MIVLDASATIEWLLQSSRGRKVDSIMAAHGDDLQAPHLLDVEVAHVLRGLVTEARITEAAGREALGLLASLPCERHSHDVLLWRIWELRRNYTAYDATYIALAEALGASLVTCDSKLATHRHHARVEYVRS